MVYRHWIVALPILVLQAVQEVVAIPGVIHLPIQAKRDDLSTWKRSAPGLHTLSATHDQKDISDQAYEVEVAVGTPPQKMTLNLDIARSTTWLISDKVFATCDGCNNGFYQLNKSKTASRILGYEEVQYGDPTTIPPSNITFDLDLHKDKFKIANMWIPKQTFGLLNPGKNKAGKDKAFSGIGGLGLGPSLEYGYKPGKPSNSVLDNLATKGHIASRTYSVDLGSYDSKQGSLIFGGIDTGKFKGKLIKRPLVKDELGTFGPSIVLTGLQQTVPKGKKHKNEVHSYQVHKNDSVFLIDSANQYLRLRHSFVDPLYKTLGAVNDGTDAYFVPCEKRNMPGSWDFQFGEVTIKIPYKSIITPQSADNGKTCWVGVLTTWKGQLVLGQPFLQAAYIAFDLDNKQVALAPPANCGHKLVAFGSGPHALPELTGC